MTKKKTQAKKVKPPAAKPAAPPDLGRLGAERWLAVRQKSGAGPMEPKARKGTRAEHEKRALDLEVEGKEL